MPDKLDSRCCAIGVDCSFKKPQQGPKALRVDSREGQ